ncbi:MAG: class I SAM-dependent rRNA methyltransferase [Acidobacteriia bacterium]|nr:class I SAM-dependent rRNA methyltransferase [Terriglobia bacterium]
MKQVRVSRRAADRVASGHPWIFSSDIADAGGASPGEAVHVSDVTGRMLGTAHYSSTSQITLRLLDSRAIEINRDFYLQRIRKALAFRESLGLLKITQACRLVHAEGDQLPGLMIDRYGDCFAVQFLSQGMDRAGEEIVSCLEELFSPRAIVARNDAASRKHEQLKLEKKLLRGELPEGLTVRMNDLDWGVDLLEGQKTGIFLDQRDNYLAAARFGFGQALDCFTCYGGFALHLSKGCQRVEAVDSSEKALAAGKKNAEANGIENVNFRDADVFDLLGGYVSARRRFDTIVLDPPAFAKSRSAVDAAVRGYRDINTRALRILSPGGVLVSCSCSHHISEGMLLEAIAEAGLEAGRTLRVLDRRTQASDHPILLTVPETHYLKCVILQAVD